MTSAVKLALQFQTQAYILVWSSRTEHECKLNVQESQKPEHIMQNFFFEVPELLRRKWRIWTQQILYSLILFSKWKHQKKQKKPKKSQKNTQHELAFVRIWTWAKKEEKNNVTKQKEHLGNCGWWD